MNNCHRMLQSARKKLSNCGENIQQFGLYNNEKFLTQNRKKFGQLSSVTFRKLVFGFHTLPTLFTLKFIDHKNFTQISTRGQFYYGSTLHNKHGTTNY